MNEKDAVKNDKEQKNDDKSADKKIEKTPEEKLKLLEEELSETKSELKKAQKEVEEWKTKATSYLNTASYYKTQAEDNKKDFERFKERNKNIERDAVMKANEETAKKIIPTIDNFGHAMSALSPEVMRGFTMIYSSLLSSLTDLGVVEIKAKGEKLNPLIHNCIETVETEDESLDGTVVKVYQTGYQMAETNTVLRPANVSVYKLIKK